MNGNQYVHYRILNLSIILCLFVTSATFAQSITGSSGNKSTLRNTGLIVDDALSITYGGNISRVTVFIATNFEAGDMLSLDASLIPRGGSSSFDATTGGLTITGNATAAQWQAVLRTVQFKSGVAARGTKIISFTLGSALLNPANGHYYEAVTPELNWTNSKTFAVGRSLFGLSGYLATITDYSENLFIRSKFRTNGWLGGSDDYLQINAATGTTTYANQAAAEGNWYWITGPEKGIRFSSGNISPTTLTFAFWSNNEPNNYNGSEDYCHFNIDGFWNDLPNTNTSAVIVEYGGTAGDPVVDISHTRSIVILEPTLTGNANEQAYYNNDNRSYPVDPALKFTNTNSATDVTVNISTGFMTEDILEINPLLIPSGVTATYNQASGTWYFSGTATADAWKPLLASVTFKTTSGNLSARTITFNTGNRPASSEGHLYELSPSAHSFDEFNLMYFFDDYPQLSTLNGTPGYFVNIQSAAENEFLKKFQTEFWLPLTDDNYLLSQFMGVSYNNQSESEGFFYWITGPSAGTLVSAGNTGSMVPQSGQYNNWNLAEPSNIGDPDFGNSTYYNYADGEWYNDVLGGLQRQFVIEYGTDGETPAFPVFTKTMSLAGVLPVTLTKFNVTISGTTTVARWETSQEKNNSHFIVERSAGTDIFKSIGRVEGSGTTGTSRNYQFTDMQPLTGLNHYRLKQVDIDNQFTYSPIARVEFKVQKNTTQIYPTVVQNILTVKISEFSKVNCAIVNAAGITVKRFVPAGAVFTVDVSTFPKGSYILKIFSGGKEESLKFIRN